MTDALATNNRKSNNILRPSTVKQWQMPIGVQHCCLASLTKNKTPVGITAQNASFLIPANEEHSAQHQPSKSQVLVVLVGRVDGVDDVVFSSVCGNGGDGGQQK